MSTREMHERYGTHATASVPKQISSSPPFETAVCPELPPMPRPAEREVSVSQHLGARKSLCSHVCFSFRSSSSNTTASRPFSNAGGLPAALARVLHHRNSMLL